MMHKILSKVFSALLSVAVVLGFLFSAGPSWAAKDGKIYVVTTLPDYAFLARELGGDRVIAEAIAKGDEDAHFVRPKPSFAEKLAQADLFVTTGLDLELWAPSVIDKSQNPNIREGQVGYVAAATGVDMLEIPTSPDRSQGGVHVYGNPHITVSPINIKVVATNIAIGLQKVDPKGSDLYRSNLSKFKAQIDDKLFGPELVKLMGSKTLCRLAANGTLVPFLQKKTFKGEKLISKLGGWMGAMLPLHGKKIVTYHKNWIYFTTLYGFDIVGMVEPKPAIPPSPKDVEQLIQSMERLDVKVVLAANYFDETKVKKICSAVGATPVIVPISVEGRPNIKTYDDLMDTWVNELRAAYGVK